MTQAQDHESKRDRVRRLLLDRLGSIGFRFPKGTDPAEAQKRLDRLADELAYMTDLNLERLFEAMRSKGEGKARDFWPSHAAFIALAQLAQPRPLQEMPGLASWFGSAAGRAALAEGRLVAEYRWWREKHRPPLNAQAKAARVKERLGHALPVDPADREWLFAFERDEAAARELVELGMTKEQAA